MLRKNNAFAVDLAAMSKPEEDEQPPRAADPEGEEEQVELDEAALLEQLGELEDVHEGVQQEKPSEGEFDFTDKAFGERPPGEEEDQPFSAPAPTDLGDVSAEIVAGDAAAASTEPAVRQVGQGLEERTHAEADVPLEAEAAAKESSLAAAAGVAPTHGSAEAEPKVGSKLLPLAPNPPPVAVGAAAKPAKKKGFSVSKVQDGTQNTAGASNQTSKKLLVPSAKAVTATPDPNAQASVGGKATARTQDAKKVATSPKALAAGAPKNAEPAAPPPKRIVAPKINETGPKSSAAGVAKTEKAAGDTAKDAKGAKRPRAPSAYSLFADQMRSSLKEERPTATFGEVNKRIAELWKATNTEDKKLYEDKAAAEKEAVKVKQAEWDAAHPEGNKAEVKKRGAGKSPADVPAAKKQKKAPSSAAPPAKPKSAYQIFCASRRPECLQDNPGASPMEVAQLLEGEWRNMTEEEQAPYQEEAKDQMRAFTNAKMAEIAARDADDEDEDGGEEWVKGQEGADGPGIQAAATTAFTAKGKKRRAGGKAGRKRGRTDAKGTLGNDEVKQDEEMEAEEEDDEITQEPESIICHDLRGKYWIKVKGEGNFYNFAAVGADKIKQLRAEPLEAQEQAFNGWGAHLLGLSDQYERFRREFEAEALECLDDHGGLNFELMQPDSSLDACALLGTMRDKDMGGLLSKLPPKKTSTSRTRKIDDCMIHVPAMQLSMVTQRLVNIWKTRALEAEAKLAAQV